MCALPRPFGPGAGVAPGDPGMLPSDRRHLTVPQSKRAPSLLPGPALPKARAEALREAAAAPAPTLAPACAPPRVGPGLPFSFSPWASPLQLRRNRSAHVLLAVAGPCSLQPLCPRVRGYSDPGRAAGLRDPPPEGSGCGLTPSQTAGEAR